MNCHTSLFNCPFLKKNYVHSITKYHPRDKLKNYRRKCNTNATQITNFDQN